MQIRPGYGGKIRHLVSQRDVAVDGGLRILIFVTDRVDHGENGQRFGLFGVDLQALPCVADGQFAAGAAAVPQQPAIKCIQKGNGLVDRGIARVALAGRLQGRHGLGIHRGHQWIDLGIFTLQEQPVSLHVAGGRGLPDVLLQAGVGFVQAEFRRQRTDQVVLQIENVPGSTLETCGPAHFATVVHQGHRDIQVLVDHPQAAFEDVLHVQFLGHVRYVQLSPSHRLRRRARRHAEQRHLLQGAAQAVGNAQSIRLSIRHTRVRPERQDDDADLGGAA